MKARGWKMENVGWQSRSVLECGSPLPLSNGRGLCESKSARGLAQSKAWRLCFCSLLSVLSFQFSAFSQSYAINWHTIDCGGGTSTGGEYSVSGTIGQPDAGPTMTGGPYSLTGGFWALPTAIPTPGAPTLTIAPATPGNATISWTPDTGTNWVLQQTAILSPSNWTNSPSGSTNPIVVPANLQTKFYRLFKP